MENFENSKDSNYNLTLNKYYTKDKNTYTNTRMGNNPGKFYINKDQYDNFLKQVKMPENVFWPQKLRNIVVAWCTVSPASSFTPSNGVVRG